MDNNSELSNDIWLVVFRRPLKKIRENVGWDDEIPN